MTEKNEGQLKGVQIAIASQALANLLPQIIDKHGLENAKTKAVIAAEALVAGLTVVSKASCSKQ